MLYLVLRFNIRLCESHNHSHTVDITLYNTVFPMPHVEEANKTIVIVIVIVTYDQNRKIVCNMTNIWIEAS